MKKYCHASFNCDEAFNEAWTIDTHDEVSWQGYSWTTFLGQVRSSNTKSATFRLTLKSFSKPLYLHFGDVECNKLFHIGFPISCLLSLPNSANEFVTENVGFQVGMLHGVLREIIPVIAIDKFPIPNVEFRFSLKTDDRSVISHVKHVITASFPKGTRIKWSRFGNGIPIYCFSQNLHTWETKSRMRKRISRASKDIIVFRLGFPPSYGFPHQIGQHSSLEAGKNVHIFSFVEQPNSTQRELFAFYAINWPFPSGLRDIFPLNQSGPYLPVPIDRSLSLRKAVHLNYHSD